MALVLFGITPESNPAILQVDPNELKVKQSLAIALSDETTPLSSPSTTVPKATFFMPYNFDIESVVASLTAAGGGVALVTVDVHISAVSIFSTRPTIDATELSSAFAATPPVFTSTPFPTVAANSKVECFLDQLDTDNTATGLKVYLIGTPA